MKGLLVHIPWSGTISGVLFSLAVLLPFQAAAAPAEETAPLLSDADGMEHYSLGSFYEASDNYLDAVREYRMAAALSPTSAEIHASLARVLLRIHEVEEAKKSAEKALRIDPKNVEALGVMVQIDVGQRDLTAAAGRLRAILEENPSDDASRMLLADLLERDGRIAEAAKEMQIVVDHMQGSAMMHFRLGNLHAQMGKTEDAIREYEAALQIDPDLLEALARSGIARETEGQLGEAAKIYRRAVDAAPTDLRVGKRLLRVLLLLDDSAGARKEAERLLALAPEDVEIREQYALLLLRSGDSEGALRELQRVEKEAPDRLSTHKHLGRYYWDRDRPQEALQQYRTVVSIDSTFVEGWVLRGYLELRVGSAEDALASFRKASQLESEAPTLAFYEGVSLSELERFDEAALAFDRALAMNPNYAEASFARGVALDRLGRTEEAAKSFRRVLELQPDNAQAMNYLGYMFAEKGIHLEEAIRLLEKAVAIEPEDGAILDSMGWALFQAGRPGEAKPWLEKAVSKEPDDAVVLDHLGDILHALGDVDGARAAWARASQADPTAAGPRAKLDGKRAESSTID